MLEAGTIATVSMRVRDTDLASAFAETQAERYPDVLSTPGMLGLMERACAKAMKSVVGVGRLSVGVKTEISHSQPTALDVEVTAVATFRTLDGALYWFDVEATDPSGLIGIAKHARAIVDRASIEHRAEQRRQH
jgi:fluoroacetyl-CoA thioesterase